MFCFALLSKEGNGRLSKLLMIVELILLLCTHNPPVVDLKIKLKNLFLYLIVLLYLGSTWGEYRGNDKVDQGDLE